MELGNEQSFKAEDERAQEASQAITEKTSSHSRSGTTKGSKGSRKISHGDARPWSRKMDRGYDVDDGLRDRTEPTHQSNESEFGGQLRPFSAKLDPGFDNDFRLEDPTESDHKFGGFGREKEEKKSGTGKGEPGVRE